MKGEGTSCYVIIWTELNWRRMAGFDQLVVVTCRRSIIFYGEGG